jgi:hypothetical protein
MGSPANQPSSRNQEPPPGGTARVFDLRFPWRRKEALRPRVGDLALEGHTCREIAAMVRLGKTTVHRWLQELQRERRGRLADTAEMIATAVARYDAIYREAMDAWRTSKAEKQVQTIEDIESAVADGRGSKQKRSLRTECRPGDVAFLAQARGAVDAICKLVPRSPQRDNALAGPDCGLLARDAAEEDDLRPTGADQGLDNAEVPQAEYVLALSDIRAECE